MIKLHDLHLEWIRKFKGSEPQKIVLHDYFEYAEGGGSLCTVLADGSPADLGYGVKVNPYPFLQV